MKELTYLFIMKSSFARGYTILNHRLVEQCVENLCHKGCRAVWGDIAALDAGQLLPEAEGLSAREIRAVVRELKAIMAVYEGTCAAG